MSQTAQAKKLIEKCQNIAIVPAKEIQGDNIGSALALFYTLKKMGKNVNIVAQEIPEKFRFLVAVNQEPKDFVISIDTSEKNIKELRYEKNEKNLKIYLALEKGQLKKEDFSLESPALDNLKSSFQEFKPDLLISVGAQSLESLGKVFEENTKIFYETPILNIDNHSLNENFGEVNLIEITSPSLAEILTNFIKSTDESILDEDIATALLAGVIFSTQNFQDSKTTPKTFDTASYLIERGGNHQKIIQHLYKTRTISQIRLLGQVLEKLNFNEDKELYWATLAEKNFQEAGATSKDLSFVVEELKLNFWKLPSMLILWESHSSPAIVKGLFYSLKKDLIKKILDNFEGVSKKGGVLFLVRENSLATAKEKVLQIL